MEENWLSEIKCIKENAESYEKKITSYFNIQSCIDEIHIKYHHALGKLVGYSNDLTAQGCLKTNFNFDKNDFILISFKSFKGQIPSNGEMASVEKKITRRRYNLFRKGRIWSQDEFRNGKNFYYFLDKLNDAFHETPINLISYCVQKFINSSVSKYVEISQDYQFAVDNDCLFFPDQDSLRAIGNADLNFIIDIFKEYLSDDFLRSKPDVEKIEKLKKQLASKRFLIEGLVSNDLFQNVIKRFRCFFKISKTNFEDELSYNQTLESKIFFASILYSYNHLPYNLHLFFPPNKEEDIENLFTIMVAKDINSPLLEEDKIFFSTLISNSPLIPKFEHELNKNASENTPSLIRWKYIFEKSVFKYSTFINTVENVCKSLCTQYEIKGTVSSRIKTFESFYNKLVERANNGDELINGYTYKDAVYKPDSFKETVFNDIRDIAGVRIICVFDDDVWNLDTIFKTRIDKHDLICDNFKRYTQNRKDRDHPHHNSNEFNYRGFHVTVIPGENRIQLIEYKNIDFVQCEIQVRTNFAHGWSDVEHPMVYKDKLHIDIIDPSFNLEIVDKLQEISKALKIHDEQIAEIKSRRAKYDFPISD